ncbi:hypothetical protein HDU92_004917 [Lobulomyces angularis]|nr:hypothetical protein HDU92_004917 [Lobulomyces angularis]
MTGALAQEIDLSTFSSCLLVVVTYITVENLIVFFKLFKRVTGLSVLALTMLMSAHVNCVSVWVAINKPPSNDPTSTVGIIYNMWVGIIWIIMVVTSFWFFKNRFAMLNVKGKLQAKILNLLFLVMILVVLYTIPVFMLYTLGLRSESDSKWDEISEVMLCYLCETVLGVTFLIELHKQSGNNLAKKTALHIKKSVYLMLVLDLFAPVVLFTMGPFFCYQTKTFSYGIKARLEMQMYDQIKTLVENRETLVSASDHSSVESYDNNRKVNKKDAGFTCKNCGSIQNDRGVIIEKSAYSEKVKTIERTGEAEHKEKV